MELAKAIETVQNTPFIGWKKLNYKAPLVLEELYELMSNLLVNLIDEAVNKKVNDNKIKENHHHIHNEERFNELINNKRKLINQHLYAAGGYISDYVISKVHLTPFKPMDIDLFIDESFIHHILTILSKSSPVKKSPEQFELEKMEYEKNKSKNGNNNNNNSFGFPPMDFSPMPSEFEETKHTDIWDLFGQRLKEVFPDCNWANNSEHGYRFSDINVVYRFSYKDTPIEFIIGNDNRILNFDLSFRSAYYIGHKFYINDLGMEDIQNKVIRILHPNTPISTLIRVFDFKDRFNYNIDDFSLMLLFSSLNRLDIPEDDFLKSLRGHKKYSEKLEKDLLTNRHRIENKEVSIFERYQELETMTDLNGQPFQANVTKTKEHKEWKNHIVFEVSHFSDYNPSLDYFYQHCDDLLGNKGSIVYRKVEALLKNIDLSEAFYNRPEDWYSDDIFKKGLQYNAEFEKWFNQEKLAATFDFSRKNEYSGSYNLTTETLDIMQELVMPGSNPVNYDKTSNDYLAALSNLPVISRGDKMEFCVERLYQLNTIIYENVLDIQVKDPHFTHYIPIYVDSKNKILKISSLSNDTYFGFLGDLYFDFFEQMKNNLGFTDYEIESHWNYKEYHSMNNREIYFIREITPIELMEGVPLKKVS